jgi:hypothetical protein
MLLKSRRKRKSDPNFSLSLSLLLDLGWPHAACLMAWGRFPFSACRATIDNEARVSSDDCFLPVVEEVQYEFLRTDGCTPTGIDL